MTDTVDRGPASVLRPARCNHLRADERGYPIIATIGQQPPPDFGAISENRKLALATFDLCAICAQPFHDELRWQVMFEETDEDIETSEAPVHEICGLYAAQICPYVSSPYARMSRGEGRKGERRPELVVLSGYQRTMAVCGKASGVQPDSVLHFAMGGYVRSHVLRSREDAAASYAAALATDVAIELDPAEQRLVDLLCNLTELEGEDSGSVMAGAAWHVGAGFCTGVTQVQGMDRFNQHPFTTISVHALQDRNVRRLADDSGDIYTRAAMQWLRTRKRLPSTLAEWRRDGRRRFGHILKSSAGQDNSAERRKAQRKKQSAARRKNRH
ncbi:hypothetical protein [Nocardia aurantiaca]|uniref:Uncharacterized protein n=1 Tax=Nocardia aurantiaca TaxID=2675850 RepID=A0A6I3L8F3_9NOCA|nr:hypothetical protein [Nocardia aurantiaca]MTE17034.1 hypothetical protein [Nocardia aurantiaca]